MILTELNDYYGRLAAQGRVPKERGFSRESVSYVLVFSRHGAAIDIQPFPKIPGTNTKSSFQIVPYDKRRTGKEIHAYPLWDKTSYAFGVTAKEDDLAAKHADFRVLQRKIFGATEDSEICAFLKLIGDWHPDMLSTLPGYRDDMLDAKFVFRLDGNHHYLHEHPAARHLWLQALAQEKTDIGRCLVTGERNHLGLHHPPIKGVRGAKTSGASLVSFNDKAYESYGRKGQENLAISRQAIFGYTTALNYLLRGENDNHQRLTIGDATVVFWARADDAAQAEAAEQFFFKILNDPPTDDQEAAKLKTALDHVADGTALAETDLGLAGDTRFYVLGLAPNAARLSVRYWCVNTLEQITRHFAQHQQDLALEPKPWRSALPPIWRLLNAVARNRDGRAKPKDIPPQLAGELTRAIFTGHRYPQSLLSNLVMRFRNDGEISGIRVALCKAVLARNARLSIHSNVHTQEIPVSLDPHSSHPGYLLGRLFAEVENAQKSAIPNTNATVGDRYYGAASATPASVFPLLLRNVRNHLGKLRKGTEKERAIAGAIQRNIQEIVGGLNDHFPKHLKIEDQGRFAIGYYHQAKARFTKRDRQEFDHDTMQGDS